VPPAVPYGQLAALGLLLVVPCANASDTYSRCHLRGRIGASGVALPGVALVVSGSNGVPEATSTALDGSYSLVLGSPGLFVVKASLAGFRDETREVTLTEDACQATLDFDLVLASRALASATPAPPPAEAPTKAGPPAARPASPPARRPAAVRFRDLSVLPGSAPEEEAPGGPEPGSQSLLPPGFSPDAPTEAVALAGAQVQTMDGLLFRDRLAMLEEVGGDLDALSRRMAQGGIGPIDPLTAGGVGGPQRGGFGGGFREGQGGFGRGNSVQGSVFYNLGDSALDASPYPLNGRGTKADYVQQRFGGTVGGPVRIPGVYDGSSRTSFFLSYLGNHSRSPQDVYSTVPTAVERSGDLSGLGRVIFDPNTHMPFQGSIIPDSRIDPSARALFALIPLPNQPGETQNFHYVTAAEDRSDQISLRLTHTFGTPPNDASRRGRQRVRGPGGRFADRRPTLNVSLTYRNTSRNDTTNFPTLGGFTRGSAWDIPVSFSFTKGHVFSQLRADLNRTRSETRNLYAYSQNVAAEAGISGISTDPFDWGAPNLSFTTFASLRDSNPSSRLDQRITLSDTMTRTFGQHTLRLGGHYRIQRLDSQTDTNARGSFVFTGLFTADIAGGRPVPATGADLADFLLGHPQQASIQYGPGNVRLRGNSWSAFFEDDWRPRTNLTFNLGLRYEYVSPFTEASGHLVNLDVTPQFTAASVVVAGGTGSFTGAFPAALVFGDFDNFAPRIGLAWKPKPELALRAGYGINFNLGAYGAIAQSLAGQPPFAVSNIVIGIPAAPLNVSDAFAHASPTATTNSFGIDKHYQLGAVHIWNLDLQRDVDHVWIVALGYAGTRGVDLDIERAPNRGPTGLRIPGVEPFLWRSSDGSSIMHSLTVRVRKRLTHGFGFGATYAFSKSLDDASSIGGGSMVVAQNDLDLPAERGRSSFDRRHRFAADYLIELPFGPGRRWLEKGPLAGVLGGWMWNGNVAIESGAPFTARVLGDFVDVARGVNGTLRANVTGAPIVIDNPTLDRWFNTSAFVVPPPGTFGDAGRNTITGPGRFLVNMALTKNISLGRPRTLSIRLQANNVFNTPQFTAIDTVVNSPTFGQVIRAGPMRSAQIQTRLRF